MGVKGSVSAAERPDGAEKAGWEEVLTEERLVNAAAQVDWRRRPQVSGGVAAAGRLVCVENHIGGVEVKISIGQSTVAMIQKVQSIYAAAELLVDQRVQGKTLCLSVSTNGITNG